jgi:hypothetical protein
MVARTRTKKKRAPRPKLSRQREARTAVVDVRDVSPRGRIAVGPMADDLDLVVHDFNRPVAHTGLRPDQHAVEMGAQPGGRAP